MLPSYYDDICGLPSGHHLRIRGERDRLKRAVDELAAEITTLTEANEELTLLKEQSAVTSTLAEAAAFVGKTVLVSHKSAEKPIILGNVQSVEILPGLSSEPLIYLRIAARTGTTSVADATPYAFRNWRFEEVG